MVSRLSFASRAALVLAALGFVVPLRAAFDLVGELPATWANGPVALSRESIEARESAPVTTVQLAGGRFRLHAEAEPGLYTVTVGDAEVSFVAGEGQTLRVSAEGAGKELKVEGGADQALYLAYEAARKESLGRLVLPVREAGAQSKAAGNEAETERLAEKEVTAYRDHRRELNDFTLEKLRGSPALYAASLRWDGDYRLDELAAVVSDYAKAHAGSEIARLMEERIARFRVTALGAVAPDLSGLSPEGAVVSLAALRGKHVLVDFWASWCAPCRLENRNYAELYRKHQAEGLEIFAVSVDQDGRGWRAAIAKDGAVWRNISDLNGWKTPLAAKYNVSALPANFLLDPEGRIIAKDIHGKQLAALLAGRLQATEAKK